MESVINLKTGRGVLNRLKMIYETPFEYRKSRFGRGWAWEIANGTQRIHDEFPQLVPEMQLLLSRLGPKTPDDLVYIY